MPNFGVVRLLFCQRMSEGYTVLITGYTLPAPFLVLVEWLGRTRHCSIHTD